MDMVSIRSRWDLGDWEACPVGSSSDNITVYCVVYVLDIETFYLNVIYKNK